MPFFTDFRAVYLPYCIEQQFDDAWVVLNRHYKPVGFNTTGSIRYQEYPVAAKIEGIDPEVLARKLSPDGRVENHRIYLYSSISLPVRSEENMDAYLKRLVILADLEITRET